MKWTGGTHQRKHVLSILTLVILSRFRGRELIPKNPFWPQEKRRAIRRSRALSSISNRNTSFMEKRVSEPLPNDPTFAWMNKTK